MADLYETLNKSLYKIEGVENPPIEISPENISSGALLASMNQVMNVLQAGKTKFTNTESGYILGLDKGTAKFYIGDPTTYLNWDGTTLTISGSLSAASGTFSGTITAGAIIVGTSALISQSRFNTLFTRFVAIGSKGDGMTEVPGTGSLVRNLMTTLFTSGDASTCSIYSAVFSSGGTVSDEVSWGNSHEFLVSAAVFGILTAYDIYMGSYGTQSDPIPADATSVVKHIGFFIWDDAVYASNGDGTTQTKTLITGVTLDDFNTYRYEFTAGSSILFYINDVLKATHTTNLPAGTDSQDPGLLLGVEGQGGQKTLHISNNYSVLITL